MDKKQVFFDVYICKLPKSLNFELLNSLREQLFENQRRKVDKLYQLEDKFRTAIGCCLLNNILINNWNLHIDDINVQTDPYGKPFLFNHKNIHFNISHSENYVVCTVDRKPIGIDIEKITNLNVNEIKPLLLKQEIELIEEQNSETGRLDIFFMLWTIKESFLKLKGKGLSMFQDTYIIKNLENKRKIVIEDRLTCRRYFINHFRLFEKYYVAYCSESPKPFVKVNMMNFQCLIKHKVVGDKLCIK